MGKLTIQFGKQMDNLLEELSERKQISKAEIIRHALAMYKYIDDEIRNGDKCLSITSAEDGKILKGIINL